MKLKFLIIIVVLIFCFNSNIKAQDNKAIFVKVNQLREKGEIDSSLSLCLSLKNKAFREKDTSMIIKSYHEISNLYYWGYADYAKTRLALDSSFQFFDKFTYHQKSYYYSKLGDAIYYDYEYVRSLEMYFKAQEFAILDKDSVMLLRNYHNIGWVYSDINMYEKAAEYGLKAVDLAKEMGQTSNKEWEGMIYTYQKAMDFDKANNALNNAIKYSDDSLRYSFFFEKKSEIKYQMNQLDSAIFYSKKGVNFAYSTNQDKSLVFNLENLIKFMCSASETDSLMFYLSMLKQVVIRKNIEYKLIKSYFIIGKLYYNNCDLLN